MAAGEAPCMQSSAQTLGGNTPRHSATAGGPEAVGARAPGPPELSAAQIAVPAELTNRWGAMLKRV